MFWVLLKRSIVSLKGLNSGRVLIDLLTLLRINFKLNHFDKVEKSTIFLAFSSYWNQLGHTCLIHPAMEVYLPGILPSGAMQTCIGNISYSRQPLKEV